VLILFTNLVLLSLLLASIALSVVETTVQITILLVMFFLLSGLHFYLLGFPLLALLFITIYGGVSTTIYLFILQVVRVDRYRSYFLGKIKAFFCVLYYCVISFYFILLIDKELTTITFFPVEWLSPKSYQNFFDSLSTIFYGTYSVSLVGVSLIFGLRFALLLVCVEFTQTITHNTYFRNIRTSNVVLLF
jgi:hypothetical protein